MELIMTNYPSFEDVQKAKEVIEKFEQRIIKIAEATYSDLDIEIIEQHIHVSWSKSGRCWKNDYFNKKIPIDWYSLSDEELKMEKEILSKKIREAHERKMAAEKLKEKKVQEEKERRTYEALKAKFENN